MKKTFLSVIITCFSLMSYAVSPIMGPTSVCAGFTIPLVDMSPGGFWSSSDMSIATINPFSGLVGGVAPGVVTITYTHSTGPAFYTVTVNPQPVAIGGPVSVTVGSTITATDATSGGTWTSSDATLATAGLSSGDIGGVATGAPVITYTLPTGCYVFETVTVNPAPSCGPVTGLTAGSITSSGATISWTAVAGSAGYQYVINTTLGAPAGSGTPTSTTSTSPTGLTASTTYYAHVRDSCGPGNLSAWVTISFTTSAVPPCGPVTGLTATGITSSGADISWTAVTGSSGYQYVINTTAGAPSGSGTPTGAITTSPTGLAPATTYYAHVRDSCGPGSFSAWVTIPFTTLTVVVCDPVTVLTATGVTSNSATISWMPVSGSSGYEFVINTTATAPLGSGTITASTSTSPSGLSPSTTYYAHVRDSCGPGSFSEWTTIHFSTTAVPPSCMPVSGLSVSAITDHSATFSWTPFSGVAGYKFVVNTSFTDPTIPGTVTHLYINATSGLAAGTTYYVHVRDSCSPGNLSSWVTVPFTTLHETGIGGVQQGVSHISAFPNPVKEVLTVKVNDNISGSATLQLMDISGKLLREMTVENDVLKINMATMPVGIYIIRYTDATHTETLRINK